MSSSTDSRREVPDGLLQVGRVGRPHGVRGDIFIDLTTDRAERAAVGSRLWIGGEWRAITTSAVSNDRWRVHFEGLDVREIAGQLTGQFIFAEPIDDPDAMWIHDIIGSRVIETDGTDRGTCVAILENPAHDILELDSGALVPATFITEVDSDAQLVTIDPPLGLFDE